MTDFKSRFMVSPMVQVKGDQKGRVQDSQRNDR